MCLIFRKLWVTSVWGQRVRSLIVRPVIMFVESNEMFEVVRCGACMETNLVLPPEVKPRGYLEGEKE